VKITPHYGQCEFGWKSPHVMVSVISGENHPTLRLVWVWSENHATLWLVWVFCFPVDAFLPWHYKNWQNSTNLLFSYFNLGGFGAFFGGLSPPNPPSGDGTGRMWDMKSIAVPQSIWLPNNCRKAYAHFGQVYPMCLIFVKNLPKAY